MEGGREKKEGREGVRKDGEGRREGGKRGRRKGESEESRMFVSLKCSSPSAVLPAAVVLSTLSFVTDQL